MWITSLFYGADESGFKKQTLSEELKTAVVKWLKEQWTELYKAGIHALIWRRNIAIERYGDYVEK